MDTLGGCLDYLREEAQVIEQCFKDACKWYPQPPTLSAPREGVNAQRQNDVFRQAFATMGVHSAVDLSGSTGVEVNVCQAVWSDPVGCDPERRADVLGAFQRVNGIDVWESPNSNGGTAGGALRRWACDSFRVPYEFQWNAQRWEMGCFLLGATASLTYEELQAVSVLDPVEVLRQAAHDSDTASATE